MGTPEQAWQVAGVPALLPPLDWEHLLPKGGRVVLVVPHPDDEVLGTGGVLQQLARRQVRVLLLAVTDGEASHPGRTDELRQRRARERAKALALLGSDAEVVRLGHPDGDVDEQLLHTQIRQQVRPRDVVIAPWRRDGHPDHDACGRAAMGVGASTWSYLVWTWHWASPEDFPSESAVRVPMSVQDLTCKRLAVEAYRSQLEGPDPILPPHVLVRLLRRSEVLLAG